MASTPHRLIFLGDRRISWEVLKHLHSDAFRDAFDLRTLVSCPTLEPHYAALRGDRNYHFISNRARSNDAIAASIAQEGITLLLSVQYNWVLPPSILDAVGRNAFNLHNAKLPDYKGYNSVSHAILNGDALYESTLHWMDDRVDEGDIAYVGTTPMRSDDHAYGLYVRTIDAAVATCLQLLNDLRDGKTPPRQPMQAGAGHFYPRDSVQKLADVTDLTDSLTRDRRVRACFFPPYNTAHAVLHGEKRYVLPAGMTQALLAAMPPANAPDYTPLDA